MVGAQREATRPRRSRTGGRACASRARAATLLLPLAVMTGVPALAGPAQADRTVESVAKVAVDGGEPGPEVRRHEAGDKGKDEEGPAIAPPAFAPAAAATPAAPPERPVVPLRKPAAPTPAPGAAEAEPSAAQTAATALELAETAAKLAATASRLAASAAKLAAKAAARARAAKLAQPAAGERPTTPSPAEAAAKPEPVAAGAPAAGTVAVTTDKSEPGVLDQAVLDHIRLEIKGRLPYFQACADAARRRGSQEVRRVQATWTIAADGTIKEMKIDGVPDAQLVACITRMGSHPFEIKPGTELTIPTPIVFVR
jgi:hypothetical protein